MSAWNLWIACLVLGAVLWTIGKFLFIASADGREEHRLIKASIHFDVLGRAAIAVGAISFLIWWLK